MGSRLRRGTAVTAGIAVILLAAGAGCSGGVETGSDPTGLIAGMSFIEWEALPLAAQQVRPPEGQAGGRGVAVILPGSEPRRLLIAVWHNACEPAVEIAAPGQEDPLRLAVRIADAETGCAELLKMWPVEVRLTREVDPGAVVVDVTDLRPLSLADSLGEAERNLRARALRRACDRFSGSEGCPPLPLCVDEDADPEYVAALEEVFPAGVLLVADVPGPGLTTTAPGLDCQVLVVESEIRYLSDAVVGFNVWVGTRSHTYWFRKQDEGWVDVSPEDVGVTDTTVIT
ncbi:MAG: hypothetical protein MUE66_05685 [Acidimicrobiia bacterium]|nr:hypothetical protein [Acidimicrobiia bacterium]